MKRIREKLKSGRGASMVFALLVFLLCVLAGTAALTAASSNIGRYTHLEDEQRQYFSVASALKVLEGKVEDFSVKVTLKCKMTETWRYNGTGTDYDDPVYEITELVTTPSTINYFNKLMVKDDALVPTEWDSAVDDWLASAGSPDPVWTDHTYTIDLVTTGTTPEWADSIYPVTVKMIKDPSATDESKYNLIAYLTTDGDAYPLRVEWPGEVKSVITDVDTVTSGDSSGDVTRETTTTMTLTLTWSGADRKIQLGETS